MKKSFTAAAVSAFACLALTACTVHQTEAPPVSGPSDLALSLRLEANPDTIGLDGGSQSSIRVMAFGPDGRPLSSVTLRVDTAVGGVIHDFGTLSARSVVTDGSGVARVTYTSPAAPPNGITSGCEGLPGECVTIVATPTSNNFGTVSSQTVRIRLVPLGVILPSGGTPLPRFTVTDKPAANSPVQFNASTSCGSTTPSGACDNQSPIVSYFWSFGDGDQANGQIVTHSFPRAQLFNVTLTVTNDRGLSASTTQAVTVGAGAVPTSAAFVFSPQSPLPNQLVFFDASQSTPAPGHVLVAYNWQFGDGATGTGITTTHAYTAIGTYNPTLTVVDEAGQTFVSTKNISVGTGSGLPTANFTFSPTSPVTLGTPVTFDASLSTAPSGATLVSYQWDFGDGSKMVSTSSPQASHTYTTLGTPSQAGNFTITLKVIDSTGRESAAVQRPIQVQ